MHKWIVALALLLLLASGCRRESANAPAEDIQVTLSAVPFPAVVGQSRLVIRVQDRAGRPLDDAALAIRGDMTHAGMAPILAEVQGGGEDGYYNVPFEWTMGGDWVVTVEVTLADGMEARQRFDMAVLTRDEAECTVDEPHE
jgi:hypothetical protein